jgi:hypothetical protein
METGMIFPEGNLVIPNKSKYEIILFDPEFYFYQASLKLHFQQYKNAYKELFVI